MAECLGSVNNPTLESIEVKRGSKGKQWASVLLGFPGNVEVRAVVFEGKNSNPITDLEAYVPGEKLPNIFAKVSSDAKGEKVYTNMQILKVGTETKEKTGFRVTGRVKAVGKTQYAHFVDIDTTDGDYESWVRLELPKETKVNPFRVGQKLRDMTIAPKGKYGTWTLMGIPEGEPSDEPDDNASDAGDSSPDPAPETPATPGKNREKRSLGL